MDRSHNNHARKLGISRWIPVCLAILAIALFFLLSDHRIHALRYLPLLLLAACPVLHMFMHGRHGGHGERRREPELTDEVN